MRLIASLILALVLAVAAYAAFWFVSLTFSSKEMRGVVERALGAESLSYGEPIWVPDWNAVAVRLPQAKIVFKDGPIREVWMPFVVLQSEFFSRSGWQLLLPPQMELRMADGSALQVDSKLATLAWLAEGGQLSYRADELRVRQAGGDDLLQVRDVMAERRATDTGIRVNLASRPEFDGAEGILSGQMILPERALMPLIDAMVRKNGGPRLKRLGLALVDFLAAEGGVVHFENVSFKHKGRSFALLGDLKVLQKGEFAGELVLAADDPAWLLGQIEQARVVGPRSLPETMGWRDAQLALVKAKPVLRMGVIPDALVLNGMPVGPIPIVREVVERIW